MKELKLKNLIKTTYVPEVKGTVGMVYFASDRNLLEATEQDVIKNITDKILSLDIVKDKMQKTSRPSDEYLKLLHQILDIETIKDCINLQMTAEQELERISQV